MNDGQRIALGIEYDGSDFRGWQSQAGGGTVQDALQAALSQVAAERVSVVASGRTDTGVHATAQVVHFDSSVRRPLSAWVRGSNALLPASVAVRWAAPVPEDFHARFSARRRAYRYLLYNHAVRPALGHHLAGWFHRPLDVECMRRAAMGVLGEQDFSAFRSSECQAKSPVRTLYRADVNRHGDWLVFDFCANGFLHHMVRNLVGSLIDIGSARKPVEWMSELLGMRDRRMASPTFSPNGLYLCQIDYGEEWPLPEAARQPRLPQLPGA